MDHDQFQADEPPEIAALAALVNLIAVGDYRDRNSVPLKTSIAYLDAKALVELSDTLGTRPPAED